MYKCDKLLDSCTNSMFESKDLHSSKATHNIYLTSLLFFSNIKNTNGPRMRISEYTHLKI